MAKPTATPPHSDLDGVDEDRRRNTDAAREAGQDAGHLDLARREAAARPAHSEEDSRDDRAR